jgi:hypothetical protein
MRMSAFLAGLALMAAWGCTVTEELPTRHDLIRVTPNANRPNGTPVSPAPSQRPSPAPSPSPSPTPAPTPSPSPSPAPSPRPSPTPTTNLPPSLVDSIRVGFFGINCGHGNPVPRNGERILPRGCRGYVTATPKKANGDDVPPENHGPDIEWFVLSGDDIIDVQAPTFPSNFNKDIVGVRPGAFGLCATVREVTGCLMGTVIP